MLFLIVSILSGLIAAIMLLGIISACIVSGRVSRYEEYCQEQNLKDKQ